MRATARRVLAFVVAGSLVLAACSDDEMSGDGEASRDADTNTTTTAAPIEQQGEGVARPEITGPVQGGRGEPFLATDVIEGTGYVEKEFILGGEAVSYKADGPLGGDGQWTLTPAETAPYRTRLLVRYPEDPDAFDGTVFVEWLNVTGGIDVDVAFGLGYPAIIDAGSAYVGVSAQAVGVEGGGPSIEIEGVERVPALKELDPERYGDLTHPGDEFSYDIFSQAAQALRRPSGVDVLGGLVPEHLIAFGQSQSASRLITYVNGVHAQADIFDGFLIHGRGAGAAPLNEELSPAEPTLIRDDLGDPVFQFQAENDISRGYHLARQPDTEMLRTWEVAGTAHADQSILDYTSRIGEQVGSTIDLSVVCPVINDGPQAQVLRAAFDALRTWVVEGTAPPTAEPLQDQDGILARDELGIALGGIRTPPVDAPTVVLSGEPVPGSSVICSLFGSMEPIPPDQLRDLYPTHEDYVEAVTQSAESAVADGFLRRAEADSYVAAAQGADIPPA
jgi:hypothetical protein